MPISVRVSRLPSASLHVSKPDPRQFQTVLRHIHDQVDARAAVLSRAHAARLACKVGCSGCCVDDLGCFEVEADRIRAAHPALLEEGEPHPKGACAFLDAQGSCRIYADRPYVCRTQGLPLRWIEDVDGDAVEYRDICHLNDRPDAPLDALPEAELWTVGPVETALARLQHAVDGGEGRRVRLRDLFKSR